MAARQFHRYFLLVHADGKRTLIIAHVLEMYGLMTVVCNQVGCRDEAILDSPHAVLQCHAEVDMRIPNVD